VNVLRVLRKFLGARTGAAGAIARQRGVFRRAYLLVRIYYVLHLCLLVIGITHWGKWPAAQALSPLWPILWVELTRIPTAVYIIVTFSLAAAMLAALFPEKRVIRAILFISLLEFTALYNSFGKIYHTSHAWLAIGFLFIFLPDGKSKDLESSIAHRQLYLTAFWGALALVLCFYSLAGFWKVIGGIDQLLRGEVHAFAPEALAYQIASRLVKTNSTSIAGPFIIDHPFVGWPLYLSSIYLECFALLAAFRPSLHRFWGLSLILLHIGSYLTMTIGFPRNILILFLFLVCSPFAPSNNRCRTILYDMPMLGWAVKALTRPRFRFQLAHD
jgi:hypothetical protein